MRSSYILPLALQLSFSVDSSLSESASAALHGFVPPNDYLLRSLPT